MEKLLKPLADVYGLNSMVVSLVLDNVDEKEAMKRVDGKYNSIAFLAGHLISSRRVVANAIGLSEEDPWAGQFGGNTPATDGAGYPSLAEIKSAWTDISGKLGSRLDQLTESDLEAHSDADPHGDKTLRGALTFFGWHESYHVGQIGTFLVALGHDSVQSLVVAALAQKQD